MKRQTIEYALLGFSLALIVMLLYAFTVHSRTRHDDDTNLAKYSVSSEVLQQQFSADEAIAKVTYVNSTLVIDGLVRSVEKDGRGSFTVIIGDTLSDILIRCAINKLYNDDAADLRAGVVAKVKGLCKGFNTDKLAGLQVVMSNCSVAR